jgi:hypothetical protein
MFQYHVGTSFSKLFLFLGLVSFLFTLLSFWSVHQAESQHQPEHTREREEDALHVQKKQEFRESDAGDGGSSSVVVSLDQKQLWETNRAKLQIPMMASKDGNVLRLLCLIPTVRRDKDPNYLIRELRELRTQMNAVEEDEEVWRKWKGGVEWRILVVSFDSAAEHPVFAQAREELKGDTRFVLVEENERIIDPFPQLEEPNHRANPENRPGKRGRQQNCDVIRLIERGVDLAKEMQASYFWVLEDDFVPCSGSLITLALNVIPLAEERDPEFAALRVSYGFSGLIMPVPVLESFKEFIRENIQRLPVDLLNQEYMHRKEPMMHRTYFVYKFILLEHIGSVSSFVERNVGGFRPEFLRCGDDIGRDWSLPGEEQFNARECPRDIISPCKGFEA